jgi:hypothetical protein
VFESGNLFLISATNLLESLKAASIFFGSTVLTTTFSPQTTFFQTPATPLIIGAAA